jgi:hypothetical protein
VGASCYTLDVNPTSSSRVKARLYETRPVREGGNVLLLQGQLSVKQFRALEALFLAGAESEGTEVLRVGRYYTQPRLTESGAESPRGFRTPAFGSRRVGRALVGGGGQLRPRAPWLTGPVIGPDGVVEDDYDTIANHHVERMLRRLRVGA